jgi:LacI family transcriptional regulator
LEHRFAQIVGHTPHQEIARVRMERVKVLLRETDLPIGEIAIRTGFEYSEYLAAAFKRDSGKTPSEFRNSESQRR